MAHDVEAIAISLQLYLRGRRKAMVLADENAENPGRVVIVY
jgi:hypothetical protein